MTPTNASPPSRSPPHTASDLDANEPKATGKSTSSTDVNNVPNMQAQSGNEIDSAEPHKDAHMLRRRTSRMDTYVPPPVQLPPLAPVHHPVAIPTPVPAPSQAPVPTTLPAAAAPQGLSAAVTLTGAARKVQRQRERRAGATALRDRICVYTLQEDKWIEDEYQRYARAHNGRKIPRALLVAASNKKFPEAKRTAIGLSNHISHNEELKAKILEAIQGAKTHKAKRAGLRGSHRA